LTLDFSAQDDDVRHKLSCIGEGGDEEVASTAFFEAAATFPGGQKKPCVGSSKAFADVARALPTPARAATRLARRDSTTTRKEPPSREQPAPPPPLEPPQKVALRAESPGSDSSESSSRSTSYGTGSRNLFSRQESLAKKSSTPSASKRQGEAAPGAFVSPGSDGNSRSAPVRQGQPEAASPEMFSRTMVKAFVEAAVRGLHIEALLSDGSGQPVVFRLCRQIDAFELRADPGGAVNRISLSQVAAVRTGGGGEEQLRRCGLAELVPELVGRRASPAAGAQVMLSRSRRVAVVELVDQRCLALRFPDTRTENGGEASEDRALAFTRCMTLFATRARCEAPPGS
jgi:hypothetical protein